MPKNITSRSQFGISLIEALVALVIVSFGILAITKLGSVLLSSNAESKVRAQAIALAEAKLEDMRNLMTDQQFASLASLAQSSAEGLYGYSTAVNQSVAFSRWYTLSASTVGKSAEVFVSWLDRSGNHQVVSVQSFVAWDDPAHAAALSRSTSTSAGAYAKTPTGRAKLGAGTTTVDTNAPTDGAGLRVQQGTDGLYRLVASDGTVLLTASTANESFSKISGRVYIDQANLSSLAKTSVYIVISDASYCWMNPTDSLTNYGSGTTYKYFDYTCYLGAAWYGNIGVVRTDNANTNDRVCVGDPNIASVSYNTDSDSRHPALATSRMYRGYKETSTGSGVYNSSGIGIDSSGNYSAATYDGHDFLITRITGNPADSDCKAKLERFSTANPNVPFGTDAVTATPLTATTGGSSPFGNPGKFFCFSTSCPSPLPSGTAPDLVLTISGSITRSPATGNSSTQVHPSAISIGGTACTIANNENSYTCTLTLPGFTGTSWSSDMIITTDGYVCASGVSGTASPLPAAPSTNTASTWTFAFSGQSANVTSSTLNFRLGKISSNCP